MAKQKTVYICTNCGYQQPKWAGKCPNCGEWGTLEEEVIVDRESRAIKKISLTEDLKAKNINEFSDEKEERVKSGFVELDRVLGGGFLQDEVVLLSGDPGIGKSTLLIQIANLLQKDKGILYVSGEESGRQVSGRSKRLFGTDFDSNVKFLGNGSLQVIEQNIRELKSQIVIVDSIQTLFDEELESLPGGIAQVKSTASRLVYLAKNMGFTLIIVSHINKDGKVAGPKVLEHLVDAVFQFEGQKNSNLRILRSLKNRFGSTGEVGIFEMEENGLKDVEYSESIFSKVFDEQDKVKGVAKSVVIEGSRPIVIDIQSLVSKSIFPYPKRVSDGVPMNKLQVISAIIETLKIVKLSESDVYLRTSDSYSIKNSNISDLAIAASLISAKKDKDLDQNNIFFGELSLNGFVNTPKIYSKYVKEILRILPEAKVYTSNKIKISEFKSEKRVVGLKNLKDLSRNLFST